MNNGILATPNFSVATDLVGIKPLLGIPQPVPTPLHFPPINDFRIGNSDGISGKDFVFVVDTTILGSTTISMPLNGLGGNKQVIDWGDGTYGAIAPAGTQRAGSFETVFLFNGTTNASITHTYAKHGIYTVILRGTLGLEYGGYIPAATAFLSYGDTNYTRYFLSHFGSANVIYVPPQIPTAVNDISACFQNNTKFNHPNVVLWDISRITNMQSTFNTASSFNQNLDSWANKVSGVTNFGLTFAGAGSFDGSVSGWILGNANCGYMFTSCSNFTGKGIPSWSVGNVTSMSSMFFGCTRLNVGISGNWNWNTSNSTSMDSMFYGSRLDNTSMSGWSCKNSNSMFQTATLNNCTMTNWKVSGSVTNMFYNCGGSNHYIPSWDLRGVTNCNSMFYGSTITRSGLDDWNVSGVTNMSNMFQYGSDFMTANLSNWNISKVTDFTLFMLSATNNPSASIRIDNWNIASGATCYGMFGDTFPNKIVSLSGWKFLGNNNCTRMFGCYNYINSTFNPISDYLNTWDTSGIVNTSFMFYYVPGFNGNIENWNVSNVTDMNNMFNAVGNIGSFNRNLGSWDVSKVTNMSNMFERQGSFIGSGIENWDVSNVTNMSTMFYMPGGGGINRNLSGWNTGKVTNMSSMFQSANNLIHNFAGSGINNWNVTGVTTVAGMFASFNGANNILKCNLSGWNLCNCTNMTNFMTTCNIGSGNYDILLNSWATTSTGNPIKPWATGINVHFGTAKYTAASSGARQQLVNYGWTITDGGFQA